MNLPNSKTQGGQCLNISFLHLRSITHKLCKEKKCKMHLNKAKKKIKNKKCIFSTILLLAFFSIHTSEEPRGKTTFFLDHVVNETVNLGEIDL